MLLMVCLWSATAFAGTDALPLLRGGLSARALGMGGAYVAVARDVRWNPAGLALVRRPGVSFSNRFQTLGSRLFDLHFHTRVAENTGLGSALTYYTVGDVPVINAQAQQTGTLQEKQIVAFVGGGYQWTDLTLGATVYYASHQLSMPGSKVQGRGIGGNVGIVYRPTRDLRVGGVAQSPLSLRWEDQLVDTSPFNMRAGVAYHVELDVNSALNLACDLEQTHGMPLKLHLGAELLIRDDPHAFAIRGGLRDLVLENRGSAVTTGTLIAGNLKPAIGLGFRWAPPEGGALRLDYALLLEPLGLRHILTLTYDF